MTAINESETTPSNIAIEVDGLTHQYPNGKLTMTVPHWQLYQGERVFLYGPSGSGKTTLLNLLAGVLEPNEGNIRLLGLPFSSLSARQRDKFRAKHIGVVFQQFNLIAHLSVLQNIQLAAYFSDKPVDVQARAEAMLRALNLAPGLLQQQASKLSVGQQQRVAIVRSLINHPEILLVDEPTSALDTDARDAFMTILTSLCDDTNTTLIFVSHDRSLQGYLERSVSLADLCQFTEMA